MANEVYTLSFDYAGRFGFGTDFTRIKVTVDGTAVNFASQSSQTVLNWQTLSFSFLGDGTNKDIRIETSPIQVFNAGRGAMIDDIVLNHADGVIAGNAVTGTKTDNLAGQVRVVGPGGWRQLRDPEPHVRRPAHRCADHRRRHHLQPGERRGHDPRQRPGRGPRCGWIRRSSATCSSG